MKPEIVLCLDSESARHPELLGLGDENLLAQPWLRLFCSAVEARQYLRSESTVQEVWVASSDEMSPINLAAALKKDSQEKGVYLLAFEGGGSMKSRANAAGLDATFSQRDLAQRYARKKVGRMRVAADAGKACYAKAPAASQPDTASSRAEEPTLPLPEGVRDTSSASTPKASLPSAAKKELAEGVAAPSIQRATDQAVVHSDRVDDPVPFSVLRPEHTAAQRQTLQQKPAFILAVVSACGGAGKSTIAALSAYFSQGLGNKTLLIDGDMQFGDMQYLMGREEPLTIVELAADPSKS
ncbi:MAG: chromosome partitioning protein ParA, partial [Raoultibacter sp.]